MDYVREVEGDNIGTYRDVSGRVNFGVVFEGRRSRYGLVRSVCA